MSDCDPGRKIIVISKLGEELNTSITNQVNPKHRKISIASQSHAESDIGSKVIIRNFQNDDAAITKPPLEDPDLPVPPDGGWGWLVVFASMFVNIIVDGVCFSFGIMYVELLEYFGESRGKTAWIGSLIPGMYLGTGPIVGALANRYGCRCITMVGSVIASVSFIISTFSTNVNIMIVTYGIMGGLGFGLMYLPSIVIVGYYFNQRRALATGLAVCGSGIGTFIFAPLSRFLLTQYGWKGANLIIAAIILNGIALGAIFRPLKSPSNITLDKKNQELNRQNKRSKEQNLQPSFIIQKIVEEKKRQRTMSTGSLDGTYITEDNKLIRDTDIVKILEIKDCRLTNVMEEDEENHNESVKIVPRGNVEGEKKGDTIALVNNVDRQCRSNLNWNNKNDIRSRSSLPFLRPLRVSKDKPPHIISKSSSPATPPVNRYLERIKGEDLGPMRPRAKSAGSPIAPQSEGIQMGSVPKLDSKRNKKDGIGSQRSLFASRISVTSFTSCLGSIPVPLYINSERSILTIADASGEERDTTWSERFQLVMHLLKEMFDFSLLKTMTFSLLCIASVLAMIGFFVPFFYITDCALKIGIPISTATFLLSVIGIANTVGRILVGWVSDQPWADSLIIHNVALIIGGIATAIVPYLPNYVLLCVYCALFGFSIAAYVALRSIVLVELLGIEQLTRSFGLLLLFQGLASIIGPPLAGVLGDLTGSYDISFNVAGVVLTLSGMVCLPIRWIARWENNRRSLLDHVYSYVDSSCDTV